VRGLELSRRFYFDAVRPVVEHNFGDMEHAAALIGHGSEVLGFDDERSRDHQWGPRVQLFVRDLAEARDLRQTLAEQLPTSFAGFSTHFGPTEEAGTVAIAELDVGPVNHGVETLLLGDYVRAELGVDLLQDFDVADWLATPTQRLLEFTSGEVFSDSVGELTRLRDKLSWYPHDVWLLVMASQWRRVAQLEHFVGRTGSRGDDLGSRVIAASLVRDLLRLALLQERRYPPYWKWLGSAYAELNRPEGEALARTLAGEDWRAREAGLVDVRSCRAASQRARCDGIGRSECAGVLGSAVSGLVRRSLRGLAARCNHRPGGSCNRPRSRFGGCHLRQHRFSRPAEVLSRTDGSVRSTLMEVDVAVLGGGPGGYTAAIRAAQLGVKVACIEREPELGGTCLRIGCIPTKAWVQTAFALKEAEHTFDKLGVKLGGFQLEFGKANEWKAGVVNQMTSGVASLFKANGVEWVKGNGTFEDAHTIAVEGGEDVTFKQAIIATGSFPLRPPIEGLDSDRCVDSEGLLAQTEVPKRLVVLGGGIIGCEFASIFRRFGSEVTIIEMLPALIPQEDADASKELAKQFGKRGITLHLEKQCTKVDEKGGALTVHFGDGETVEADLMLVSVGRGPNVEGIGLETIGVEFDKRKGIAADEHRRTTVEHIYAVGDCAGYWQLAHTAFREGEVAAENACGHDAVVDNRAVPRPIYTDPEIAGVGLTEAEAREQYGDDVATGMFPWVANARAVMQNDTTGWVKSIHETRYGELLGLVMVGPHVTDLIEAGVVAIDAEATVETVADGMAAHPTLSEAIKEAGLVALGRPIHVPIRKRAKTTA